MSVKEHSEGDSQLFLDSKNNKHEIEMMIMKQLLNLKIHKPKQMRNDASNKDSHQSEDDEISNEDQKEEPSTDNIDKEKDDE